MESFDFWVKTDWKCVFKASALSWSVVHSLLVVRNVGIPRFSVRINFPYDQNFLGCSTELSPMGKSMVSNVTFLAT